MNNLNRPRETAGGFDKGRVFDRSPHFRLERADGKFFFIHTSGNKVATDAFGAMLWEAMPGTADEIAGRIGDRADVSRRMLREFLRLMECAEIAVSFSGDSSSPDRAAAPVTAGVGLRPAADPGPPSSVSLSSASRDPSILGESPGRLADPPSSFRATPSSGSASLASSTLPGSSEIQVLPRSNDPDNKGRVAPPPPPVSVVIVTLNGKAHIRECLASLRAQTAGPLDIHVVDNGSTDGTQEIVRDEFPEARLHALSKNLFYPGGVNYGIEHTAGPYILVLNDDVELTPGFTAEMVRVMEASPRAAAVVPMMKLFYLRGFINGIGNHVRTKGWGSDNFVGYIDIGQFEGVTEVPSACVSAALLRRAAIEASGAFDAAYRAYYEDADWSFRMRRAGWTINAAPRALVYHKFSAFWKNMERKLKLAARNRLRFVLKNFDGRLRRAFLRSYFKEDLINILSLFKHGRSAEAWAYLRAYGSLVLTLPDIWDKRAEAGKTWIGGGKSGAKGSGGGEEREGRAGSKGRAGSVEAILELNPPQWSGMNTDNVPRLDAGIYFAYYARQFAWLEAGKREGA